MIGLESEENHIFVEVYKMELRELQKLTSVFSPEILRQGKF